MERNNMENPPFRILHTNILAPTTSFHYIGDPIFIDSIPSLY